MINLKNIKNQKYIDIRIVEILFYTFPVSFIIGNLILSAHLLLFIILSLVLIKKQNLPFRVNKLNFIPIIFFLYLFLSTTIQFPDIFNTWSELWKEVLEKTNENPGGFPLKDHPAVKSFLLIRFILLLIIIDILFINKILSLKKLFLVSFFCTSFVSFDIIIQFLSGFDIFGLKKLAGERYSGPFGDESIAGGYLQRFSLLSFFCFYFLKIGKKNFNSFFFFFLITMHAVAIFLSGNRMPLIVFLFGCFLTFILVKNFRFIISLSMAAFISIFFVIASNNQHIGDRYSNFFAEINLFQHLKIKNEKAKLKVEEEINEEVNEEVKDVKTKSRFLNYGHGSIFKTSIYMWKTQPLFGYGLKSFRFKCWEILDKTKNKEYSCSNHSHNYYIELLAEAGIVGIFLVIAFFAIIIKNSFNYFRKNYKKNNLEFYFFISIFITFLVEIWPIKSTGSFFTTWNATFIWIIVSILCAVTSRKR